MKPSEPRPGYRTTVYMETVDPEGFKMSDTLQNWYGKDGPESNMQHNMIGTAIVGALNETVKYWAAGKAVRDVSEFRK